MVKPLSRTMQSLLARSSVGGSGRGLSAPLPTTMAPVSAAQLVANVQSESGGRKVNPNVRTDSWGNSLTLPSNPAWFDGQMQPVLDLDDIKSPTQADWRIPYTQAIILASKLDPFDVGNFFTRWVIETGIGDGRTTFELDGLGVQQITLPSASLRILYKVVRADSRFAFASPAFPIQVSAFTSDGTTATAPPTFTQAFTVAANGGTNIVAPYGATGWRIASSQPNPFTANTNYEVQNNTVVIESYTGLYLSTIRQNVMPFSGQAISLTINNTANPAGFSAFVVWTIDL